MVKLTRTKLNRNKMDKAISIEVKDAKNVTEQGALRVNKSLFGKESTDNYMGTYTEAGKYFYRVTLPWDDRGWRLLSVDLYEEFTKKFKSFTKTYREQVLDFIGNISAHVEDAKAMLGDAFDVEDYRFLSPNGGVDREMLLKEFSLEVSYDTVTDGDDLRACLSEVDREVIAAKITEQATAKFAKANEHIVQTLHDHILAIHERLCVSENIFRDTLISNLEDLCDLIPKLNIAGDPRIDALAAEAKAKLTKWEPAVLREVPSIRETVSKEAAVILDNMKGIM